MEVLLIVGTTTSSLTFSAQNLGSTSTAQTFTLNNTGNVSLTITSIAFSGTNPGDFGQTNTCGGSVAASGSCTISVKFTPTATGTRSASLVITDNSNNAAGSQQTVSVTGTGSAPVASVGTGSLTFSSQTLSTTSTAQTVTLNNTGNLALSISSIGFTGTNPGDFGQTNTCGSSLAAGGNCTVSVTFTPTAIGSRAASLVITDNSGNVAGSQQSVTLSGTGTSPIVSLNFSALSFSNQTLGTTSTSQSVTLTNTGNATLNITSILITGTNVGDFAQTNTCGTSVAALGTCTINVTFTPQAILGRSASISIADNAPGTPQSVSLTGTGTAAVATVSVATVTFGNQAVLVTSGQQTFTLTNTGNLALTITSITLTGTNSGDFSQTNNCPISPSTLVASSFCTVTVTFTPSASGSRTAAVSIADNATAGSPQAVSLIGTGVIGTVGLSASTLPFGSQSVGTTSTPPLVVTLTNGGTSALSITSIQITGTNPGDFAITNNTCGSSLGINGTCTVSLDFAPTTAGSRAATLTFTDTATNSPQTVSLSGSGTAPEASLSPTSYNFGNQPDATGSTPAVFTLSNTGTAVLNIASITFTGTNASDFSESTTCGTTLAVNSTCTIAVTFTPGAPGSRSATLVVTDNNNNVTGSTQTATLTGNGVPDIILSWTASPTGGVVGYYVYRGTSAGGESTTPINSTPMSGNTYTDATGSVGTKYYYYVTAVAGDGITQSAPSNEASATVP